MNANEQLDRILHHDLGLFDELYYLFESIAVVEALDGFVVAIRDSGRGKNFFASLQVCYTDRSYLAMAKVFDPPHSSHPTSSLRTLAEFLRDHAPQLRIVERGDLRPVLGPRFDQAARDPELTELLASRIEDSLDDSLFVEVLRRVRYLRNKSIAHRERVDPKTLVCPDWQEFVTVSAGQEPYIFAGRRQREKPGGDLPLVPLRGLT